MDVCFLDEVGRPGAGLCFPNGVWGGSTGWPWLLGWEEMEMVMASRGCGAGMLVGFQGRAVVIAVSEVSDWNRGRVFAVLVRCHDVAVVVHLL